jgi:hypothetical protein
MCGAVMVAAVVGKGVACWLVARATGISNREALGIGTLMNARPDGIDHHQYWPSAWHYLGGTLRHAGHHGSRHHAHDVKSVIRPDRQEGSRNQGSNPDNP